MANPVATAPTSITGLDAPSAGEPMASTLHGIGLRREVLEECSLPIIEIDLQRRVRYANPAAIRLLGIPAEHSAISLDSLFVDEESKRVFAEEVKRRRAGFIGNYRVTARRFSDARDIPLEITGLPISDERGDVVIGLGLLRSLEWQELGDAIRALSRPGQSPEELLAGLAAILKRSMPFEQMVISRLSTDGNHIRRFFSTGLQGPAIRSKRWWALTDAMKQWQSKSGSTVIADLDRFFDNPVWAPTKNDPVVQELFRAGIKSVMRRDVYRGGEKVCSISLMSRELNGFSQEQQLLFMSAPVAVTALHALELAEKAAVTQRLNLLKTLNRCTDVDKACRTLAEQLAGIFDWPHVSIFRVDRSAGILRLLAQRCRDKDPIDDQIRLPERYEQAVGKGILGRVVATGEPQNIGNVLEDADYVRSLKELQVMSELCVPVRPEGEKDVRWIINVEETQQNAFASDELAALQEIAEEVGGLMQRFSDVFFLTQCFEHASEAIFVTNEQLMLRRVNPAAANLLGYKDASEIKGNICDYLEDRAACVRLSAPVPGDLGEIVLKRLGTARGESGPVASTVPAFFSRRDFPEGLTGSIFVARDTSAMRKTVQAGILEKAAYSVAVETCTPLSAAISELESIVRRSEGHEAGLERVVRQLGRVRQGYVRLAMFNPDARPATSTFAPLNLQSELEALARNLAETGRVTVAPAGPGPTPLIEGDHFQIGFVLETLLVAMLRYAPQDEPVTATVSVVERSVKIQLRGYLGSGIPTQDLDAPWVPSDADMAIAKPLIDEFVANHNGSWLGSVGKSRRAEINLQFPLAGR